MPSLTVLSLYIHTKHGERIVIGKDGFSVLKYFKFKSCDPWLKFEMDSMSNLRKLKLVFNTRRGDQRSMMPVGMEHLSGLEEASAKIGGDASHEVSDRTSAELAFRDAMRVHARCPRVTVLCVNEIIGCVDDEISKKREEEYTMCPQMLPMKGDGAPEPCISTEEDTTEGGKMLRVVPSENADKSTRVRYESYYSIYQILSLCCVLIDVC